MPSDNAFSNELNMQSENSYGLMIRGLYTMGKNRTQNLLYSHRFLIFGQIYEDLFQSSDDMC